MVEEAHLWLDSGKVFGPATAQFERFNLACLRVTLVKAMETVKKMLLTLIASGRENKLHKKEKI